MAYSVQECVGAIAKRIHLDTAYFREIVYQAPGADRPVVVAYIRVEYADPVCATLNISGVDPCLGIEPRVPSAADDKPASAAERRAAAERAIDADPLGSHIAVDKQPAWPDDHPDDTVAGDAKPCRAGTLSHREKPWCSLPDGHDGPHTSPSGKEWDGVNGTTTPE